MGFSIPLCTVTTCETLPTDGTKSMLLKVKALTPPCLPLADRTQPLAGLGSDARITSREITEFSVRVHHNVGACSCGSKSWICWCPRPKNQGKFSEVPGLAVSLGLGHLFSNPPRVYLSRGFPHTVLCGLLLLSQRWERWNEIGFLQTG
jgi:hypothetical protein